MGLERRGMTRIGVLTGMLLSSPVLAQERAQSAPETVATNPSDDILVQARRRSKSIEDVPASVSVLDSAEMERLAVRDVVDYTRLTPGAILVGSGPKYLNDIALRGQGGGRLGFSKSSTGIYRDGIYVAGGGFGGRSYSQIDFYDIDRVEVYRGPQGALYGRNAVGGAVNVISRQPLADTELRAKVGYNSVDKLDTQLTVNVPLTDTVAIRAGGFYSKQSGGFYTDQVTGRVIDNTLDWGVRGAIGAEIGTDTSATLTIEHSRSEAPGFTSLGRNRTLDPDIFVRTGLDAIDRVTIDQTQAIGEFRHDFGTSELTVLADYKGRDGARSPADFDHYLGIRLPNVLLLDAQGEKFERYGAEARWGSKGDGPITWLGGVDFLDLRVARLLKPHRQRDRQRRDRHIVAAAIAAAGIDRKRLVLFRLWPSGLQAGSDTHRVSGIALPNRQQAIRLPADRPRRDHQRNDSADPVLAQLEPFPAHRIAHLEGERPPDFIRQAGHRLSRRRVQSVAGDRIFRSRAVRP